MDSFLRFVCPICAKRLKALPEHAGRTARCSCGQSMLVPAPYASATRVAPASSRKDRCQADLAEDFFQIGGIVGAVVGGALGFVLSFIPEDQFRPISLTVLGGVVGYFSLASISGFVLAPLWWRLTSALSHSKHD